MSNASPPYGFRFADPENSYASLPASMFAHCEPTAVKAPVITLFNTALATSLGLDAAALNTPEGAMLLGGNTVPAGSTPLAQAYAGHQFGHPNMLGDGRAILLFEQRAPDGQLYDIQLKGAGRTPYSRGGDGRAGLGPMLREYIISEAMQALGIATTRSLAVVSTGEPVQRETALPGAVLTRVATSHVRVGTFQFAASREDKASLQALVDFVIARHYLQLKLQLQPQLASDSGSASNTALVLIEAVMDRQIDLVVDWMRVGFIHGVLNTDNVTLSGETIDYGPCAFMDSYHPETVFSSIDHQGRYAYANQPAITQWNLARFAETLLPLIADDPEQAVAPATDLIRSFPQRYAEKWLAMMRRKLGLFGEDPADEALATDLLKWMQSQAADYTNTFRDLSSETRPEGAPYDSADFRSWYDRWQARLAKNTKPLASSLCLMRNSNPAIIPRNHQVEKALDAASSQNDLAPTQQLLAVLATPYEDGPDKAAFKAPPAPEERVCQTFCGT
ncbi:YdiU family protein [Alcanivorax sp. JB21]|uniref:protein adenylyltransferase SelO n=1 Tax=Alcanivorax limicola TaxID=2874102 RepID=UPI001CBB50F7|nr:YdiU family protein [Alcanivorax limicola]MBZ2190105.1 YdiU family protein [Alcanivorax limicola]